MQDQLKMVHDLLARNEVRKAEIILAKHLRSSSLPTQEQSEALVIRSRIRLRSGRPEDAIADFLEAQNLDLSLLDRPEMLELMADCYLARFELASVGFADRQDANKAHDLFSQLLDRFPIYSNRGWVHYQLGRIALSGNDVAAAQTYFRDALLNPSSIRALTAYCYERLGFIQAYENRDLELALGLLDKAIYAYPDSEPRGWLAQIHVLRSRVLREDRKHTQAVEAAEFAVNMAMKGAENESVLSEALLTLAELLAGFENRDQDVVAYLQQFLQISKKPLGIDVTWSRVYEMIGDAYFKLAHYAEAAETYETALQYNPDHPWGISLQYRVARSYYLKNDYPATIAAINKLIADAHGDGEHIQDFHIYDVLGNAQFALGRYSDAMSSYKLALDLAPSHAEEIVKIKKYYQFAEELS